MSKLSTLRRITKVSLIGLAVCIVLVAAGLWGNQAYPSFFPTSVSRLFDFAGLPTPAPSEQVEYITGPLLIPTHPDLVSQTSLQTTAMPLEEARKIREPLSDPDYYSYYDYYYPIAIDLPPVQAPVTPNGNTTTAPIRDIVIITRTFYDTVTKEIFPSLPKLWTHECCEKKFAQVERGGLKNAPVPENYMIVSEIARNGALITYKAVNYDPSLFNFPIPPEVSIRTVPADENEYYTIYIKCAELQCTKNELADLVDQYGFAAMESMEESLITSSNSFYFGNFVFASENQILEAMSNGRISWYQRYDTSHWRLHYPEAEEMDKSVSIQITTYLPEDLPAEEREVERKRIEQLVRDYGGKTFQEKETADPGGFWKGVLYDFRYQGHENELLIDKDLEGNPNLYTKAVKPIESFLFRKNINDFIVPDFPADKIWDLMQDPSILRVNKAHVVRTKDSPMRIL